MSAWMGLRPERKVLRQTATKSQPERRLLCPGCGSKTWVYRIGACGCPGACNECYEPPSGAKFPRSKPQTNLRVFAFVVTVALLIEVLR